MKIVANAYERARLYRTVGTVLLIAAPGLALGTWWSTQQPIEILALAERMRTSMSAEDYASAVYHGSHAQTTLDNMWRPTGFATLGIGGFVIGAALVVLARRPAKKLEQSPAT